MENSWDAGEDVLVLFIQKTFDISMTLQVTTSILQEVPREPATQ